MFVPLRLLLGCCLRVLMRAHSSAAVSDSLGDPFEVHSVLVCYMTRDLP